jgi:hypothetical protein
MYRFSFRTFLAILWMLLAVPALQAQGLFSKRDTSQARTFSPGFDIFIQLQGGELLGKPNALLMNYGMRYIHNKHFLFGIEFGNLQSNVRVADQYLVGDAARMQWKMNYTQLALGYVLFPERTLFLLPKVNIGGGTVRKHVMDQTLIGERVDVEDSRFFLLNPELQVGLHLMKWIRLYGSVGYRFGGNSATRGANQATLSAPFWGVGISLGLYHLPESTWDESDD